MTLLVMLFASTWELVFMALFVLMLAIYICWHTIDQIEFPTTPIEYEEDW